jgi:hypothetical protein
MQILKTKKKSTFLKKIKSLSQKNTLSKIKGIKSRKGPTEERMSLKSGYLKIYRGEKMRKE